MKYKSYDVCIITTIHKDFDNRIFFRQALSLVNSGMKVCIIAPWNFKDVERGDYDFIDSGPYPSTRFLRIFHSIKTYRHARKINSKVFIFHDPDFLLPSLFLKNKSNNVVYDCHENIPEDILYGKPWIPKYLRKTISRVYRLFENFIVHRLQNVICVVPYQVDRFNKIASNVGLVRNFSKVSLSEGLKNKNNVIYIGSLSVDYGVYTIIDIARELKRRKSDIVINIVDYFGHNIKLREDFLKIVDSERLPITMLDRVPASKMSEILINGCVGISPILELPNKEFVYPTKIFEYFSANIAVIASDVGYTKSILKGGELGVLIKFDDINGWVDSIEQLMTNEVLRQEYIERGRKSVQLEYSWESEEKRLVSYVTELTN